MGYRSQVGLCLTGTAAAILKEKIAQCNMQENTFMLTHADTHAEDADSGAEMWTWDWVKWYDDFSEVDFIVTFMAELEWDEYLFIRIGEEHDDNEVSGSFWDNPFEMALSRTIDFCLPASE